MAMQDTEILISHMLVKGYLEKVFKDGPYKVQVYVKQGPLAKRLDEGETITIPFLVPDRASRNRSTKGAASSRKRKAAPHPRVSNSSARTHMSEDEDEEVIDLSGEYGEDDDASQGDDPGPSSKRPRSAYRSSRVPTGVDDAMVDDDDTDDDSEPEGDEWKGNLRGAPAATHRTLRSSPQKASGSGVVNMPCDNEIIEILSE